MARTNTEIPAATSRQRTLAGLLRTVFDQAKARDSKVTMRQLATQLGIHHSTVSRWLSGEVVPDPEQVSAFLACLGVVGDEREKIMRLARGQASADTWVTTGPPGINDQQTAAVELQSQATAMIEWQPLVVCRLLQTEAYARWVISNKYQKKISRAELEHRVALRMGLQHAVLRDDDNDALPFLAILGIPAIRGRIGASSADGPNAIMLPQLKHLARVCRDRSNIKVRLVEVEGDWHGGLLGSFVVYEFAPPMPSIVCLEHHRTASFVDDSTDVKAYHDLRDELLALAYEEDESLALIEAEIEKREKTRSE
ncbi:helix-turn-helix transcriptional regulator [Amycolatopsis sp. NEAU-NG30]|uniref:Helix-turn-helix transcriptional regulator n=1 Tax=Amycolatopsis melonis TaxID=3156488 RepID=A0ABV0LFK9_9PSEU